MAEARAEHSITTSPDEPSGGLRLGLFVTCALHALPLGWAAFALPFRTASWLTLALSALALLHAVVAGLALARRPRWLSPAWLALSLASLLFLLSIAWISLGSALYLKGLYRSVGSAVGFGLFAFLAIAALFTLPIACWGLSQTLPLLTRFRRAGVAVASALFGLALVFALGLSRAAETQPVAGAAPARFERLLSDALARAVPAGKASKASLHQREPALCRDAVGVRPTLFVAALDRGRRATLRCLQADGAEALVALAAGELEGAPGELLLDLVTGTRGLSLLHPLLDAFALRPLRDGLCADRSCFAPWQLAARGAFSEHRPIPGLPEGSIGSSLSGLAGALGADPARAHLTRITTQGYLWREGKLTRRVGFAPEHVPLDAKSAARARTLAERHIVAAQADSGAFRYTLDPFSGASDLAKVSLPRQAGTVLVLCELGARRRSEKAIGRALGQLADYERRGAEFSALSDSAAVGRLGSTALPLVAFLTCRERAGRRHDALIGRLVRAVLAMQRPDGSFFPELDLATFAARGRHESLYSAGQAVLALVLGEQLARAEPELGLPDRARLGAAVDRAMEHYAERYWPRALRDLFYLEENWHCLAARAALASHRNDAYERFCADYVAFKSRLILTEADAGGPEHQGGYGVTYLLPPHNTPTAGFGEALSAAIAVKRKRGEDTSEDEALLARVLAFLVRQQWTPETCAACTPEREAVGGFSESATSPVIRIDYVQHAMAAIGHGSRVLGWN